MNCELVGKTFPSVRNQQLAMNAGLVAALLAAANVIEPIRRLSFPR